MRVVHHVGAFIESRFRIIAYLMRTSVHSVYTDRPPRIFPCKRVPYEAEHFSSPFKIFDFSGKSVFGHLFSAGIQIETSDQRIKKVLSRNGEISCDIIFPTEYERHNADLVGNATRQFDIVFFRIAGSFFFGIRPLSLRYNIDNAAHRVAAVQNGIRPLDNFDTFDVFDGYLKNRCRTGYIGRNAHSVYHNFDVAVAEPLHRNGFVCISGRSCAHRNIGQGF